MSQRRPDPAQALPPPHPAVLAFARALARRDAAAMMQRSLSESDQLARP